MANDAFTAGVVPGGLTSHSEVKILICFILQNVSGGVSYSELINSLTESGLANYFELVSAVDELSECGHISAKDNRYSLTQSGKLITELLSKDLPITVREKSLSVVRGAVINARREKQNLVEITEAENGYQVHCYITDDVSGPLFSLTVYAPTKEAAKTVKKNFIEKAELLLRYDMSQLTGEEL